MLFWNVPLTSSRISSTLRRSLLNGRRVSSFPLQQGWGSCPWARKLWMPQVPRPGHEGAKAAGRELPMTISEHRWQAVWLRCHTWPFLIWKRHLIVYPDVWPGKLFVSLAIKSGWWASYRECMKMPESKCMLVATWEKNSVWKWEFTKALAWAPYCSSRYWKPFTKSTECPWENVNADDMVTISESLEELQDKLILWKSSMEGKGLLVNMGKIKILISGLGIDVLKSPAKTPLPVVSWVSCVSSTIFHAGKTWAPTSSDLHHLQHNDWPDTTRRSGKNTLHQLTQMAWPRWMQW